MTTKESPTTPAPITLEQARAALAHAEQERVAACWTAIEAAMQQHGCTLQVALILRPGQHPEPLVQLVPVAQAAP